MSARPVYGQLRNVVDLTIVAAVICREDWYGQTGIRLDAILDEARLPIETFPAPKQVACPVNVLWKGNRMLALAGGGVQWNPDEGVAGSQPKPELSEQRPALPKNGWYW